MTQEQLSWQNEVRRYLWQVNGANCPGCASPAAYYDSPTATRDEWFAATERATWCGNCGFVGTRTL